MKCRFLLVLAVMSTLSACGTRELTKPVDEAFPARFSAIRERILIPRCANCHTKVVALKALLDDLVVPGAPERSSLFTEIDTGEMPKYGGKLPDEEIGAIKTWIANGAQND